MPAPARTVEQKLLSAVVRYRMLSPGDDVLVACSGGQEDSFALLLALETLAGRLGVGLHVAHLNHGLRAGEAEQDAAYVTAVCDQLGLGLTQGQADVAALARAQGQSLEEAGRAARHDFLRETARDAGCGRIALGHTATDRVETVLMNILRGAGLDGLRGIPATNQSLIRPLILASRPETADYCAARGFEPRQDSSNLDTDAFMRNRIRLELLPHLADRYTPGVEAALLRLAEAAEMEVGWTQLHVEAAYETLVDRQPGALELNLDRLRSLPDGLLQRTLRLALAEIAGSVTGLSAANVADLVYLVYNGQTGAEARLPRQIAAQRGYETLRLTRGKPPPAGPEAWEAALTIPGQVSLPHGGVLRAVIASAPAPADLVAGDATEAWCDPEAVGTQLSVRSWRTGDRVAPLGLDGTRKLQDVFVDAKVPREKRIRVPVVADEGDRVLWVAGLCLSQWAALPPGASRCVHLTWQETG